MCLVLRLFFWPLTERARKLKEAEERAKNRPRVFKEPKSKAFKSWETLQNSLLIQLVLPFNILCCMSVYVADCPPLGMESHKIESDQLSASSMSQYSFSPQRARLNMQVYTTHWSAILNTLQQSLTYCTSRPCNEHKLPSICWKIMLLLCILLLVGDLTVMYARSCVEVSDFHWWYASCYAVWWADHELRMQ